MIEDCAEKIVTILAERGEANILRLSEYLAERSLVTYQALGWLARAGKIRYESRGNQVFVALRADPLSASSDPTERRSS
ncbi:MAG: winged helix-turn-helix domain-containing protein [Spirochaetia bacterium]